MTDDDLERILTSEEEIVPSSGFAAGVMDAVRRDASITPPIPFPWKWALPGLACWIFVLLFAITAIVRLWRGGMFPSGVPSPTLVAILAGVRDSGAEWIALALLISLTSITLLRRVFGV